MKRLSLQQVAARPDGCDVSDRCMDCPLAACRFDEPALLAKRVRQVKDLVIYRLRESGLLPPEIAAELGWNERAVYRALARHKEQRPEIDDAEFQALLPFTAMTGVLPE